uniref:Velvet domain-containing protein n=1 Tax=Angiostrongylus cantonensis TaxID=6313 RepID=A0A0K0D3N9_ANGCA
MEDYLANARVTRPLTGLHMIQLKFPLPRFHQSGSPKLMQGIVRALDVDSPPSHFRSISGILTVVAGNDTDF